MGVFAHRIVVQHQHFQPHSGTSAGPFQHLTVAVRVAECSVGRLPMNRLMPIALLSWSSIKNIFDSGACYSGVPSPDT